MATYYLLFAVNIRGKEKVGKENFELLKVLGTGGMCSLYFIPWETTGRLIGIQFKLQPMAKYSCAENVVGVTRGRFMQWKLSKKLPLWIVRKHYSTSWPRGVSWKLCGIPHFTWRSIMHFKQMINYISFWVSRFMLLSHSVIVRVYS